jgi:hypothetical protein
MSLHPPSEPSLEDAELENWQYGDSDRLLNSTEERFGVYKMMASKR